jgi:DegV family protein with EDD domain
MVVRVVTDSTADLPPELASELGIAVVPLYVRFGEEVFRDGVDLTVDDFYRRLTGSAVFPSTTAPSPGDFYGVYSRLALETSEILSIHISTKLSGTYNAALLGRERMQSECRVEIIDSLTTSLGLGLLAVAAAKAARAGATLKELSEMVRKAVPRVHLFGLLDTLEYLHRGGRIGKAQAFLGTLMSVKPLIDVRDGEVYPLARARSRARGMNMLSELMKKFPRVDELALVYSTDGESIESLAEILPSQFPKEKMYRARFGPVVGSYVGPRSIAIALLESD